MIHILTIGDIVGSATVDVLAACLRSEARALGADLIIANGEKPSYLYDIVEGKAVGTRFLGKK